MQAHHRVDPEWDHDARHKKARTASHPGLLCLLLMVRPERFELPTAWFVARYSIQLSYGRTKLAIITICSPRCQPEAVAERESAKWGSSAFQKLPANVSTGAVFKGIEFQHVPPNSATIRVRNVG